MRRDGEIREEPRHELSPIADGPYTVVSVKDDTVVLRIEGKLECVSRDSIEKLSRPESIMENEEPRSYQEVNIPTDLVLARGSNNPSDTRGGNWQTAEREDLYTEEHVIDCIVDDTIDGGQ